MLEINSSKNFCAHQQKCCTVQVSLSELTKNRMKKPQVVCDKCVLYTISITQHSYTPTIVTYKTTL